MCGPSATEKPISAKMAVSSSMTWLTGWMVPCAAGRGLRRDVQPLGAQALLQRRVGQRRLAGGDGGVDLVLQRVEGGAGGLALLGRHAAELAHHQRDLALLAERGDAHRLDRRLVGGVGDRRRYFALIGSDRASRPPSPGHPAQARCRVYRGRTGPCVIAAAGISRAGSSACAGMTAGGGRAGQIGGRVSTGRPIANRQAGQRLMPGPPIVVQVPRRMPSRVQVCVLPSSEMPT